MATSGNLVESSGPTALADIAMCEIMQEALAHYYPRHYFFIECNNDKKVAVMTIQLLYEDAKKVRKKWRYGMLIHLKNLDSYDAVMKYAKNYGGELLERYNMARCGANPYTWIEAQTHKLDLSGMR